MGLGVGGNEMQGARKLVRSRVEESRRERPVMHDPYASTLMTPEEWRSLEGVDDRSEVERQLDAIVTGVLDSALMEATSIVHPDYGDYNQVVLFSPGLETRPFRLPWPRGTVLYDVAEAEVHEECRQRIQERAPRGCLHIRIPYQGVESFSERMERAGFRGDRLSVWAIQGLHLLDDIGEEELEALFVEISHLSQCKSLILGELPLPDAASTSNFLAKFSLLTSVTDIVRESRALNWDLPAGVSERCMVRAQQQLRSLKEQEIYAAHVQAAEETDEDFSDNFS